MIIICLYGACGRTNIRPYRLSEFRLKPGIYQGMHVCSSAIVSQSSCSNNPHSNVRTHERVFAIEDKQRISTVVAVPCAGLASKNKRIICHACNNPPPNSRDARSSVRTNEQPNRIRSLTYVDKHNLMIIIRLYGACEAVSKVHFELSSNLTH